MAKLVDQCPIRPSSENLPSSAADGKKNREPLSERGKSVFSNRVMLSLSTTSCQVSQSGVGEQHIMGSTVCVCFHLVVFRWLLALFEGIWFYFVFFAEGVVLGFVFEKKRNV